MIIKMNFVKTFKSIENLTYMFQACKDRDMNYYNATIYFKIHETKMDIEKQNPRKTR